MPLENVLLLDLFQLLSSQAVITDGLGYCDVLSDSHSDGTPFTSIAERLGAVGKRLNAGFVSAFVFSSCYN